MAVKKRGKVIIFPHAHIFSPFPEKETRKLLKGVDVINVESHQEKGKLDRIASTVAFNILSRTGISLFDTSEKMHESMQDYYRSLSKAIARTGRQVEIERGIPQPESSIPAVEERTKKDIEQIERHVKKGKVVGILRGSSHAYPLVHELRKRGIEHEIVPLGGVFYSPMGTPLVQGKFNEAMAKHLKTGKHPESIRGESLGAISPFAYGLLRTYPSLREYPTALVNLAGFMEKYGIKDPGVFGNSLVFDAAGKKWLRLEKT